jgi:cytochrome P450
MTDGDGLKLLDPALYAKGGPPHDFFRELRASAPVSRFRIPERRGVAIEPFWAITKHADIQYVSKRPHLFLSEPGITLAPLESEQREIPGFSQMRVVITMDPPEHRSVRKVASPWFTPRSVKRIEGAVRKSAKQLVDALAEKPGEVVDLATEVAIKHPLRILATALGIPEEQEPKILELSNRLFAPDDEELGGGRTRPEDFAQLGQEFLELFLPIIQDRRQNPTDDLASVLANGQVDGAPMGPMETLGYYLIVFNAGHDTTKNALAGGLRALVEHPDQFERLRQDPSLVPSAVEEILRWTSPVNYMKRTAAEDVEVHGQKIPKGEALVLFYASANRDEDVFRDPYLFDVARKPNTHIAFGYGEHFCMGAHFARQSLVAIVDELVRRVEHWELAGEPEWIQASFVVGLKHLPVRVRVAG